MFFRNANNQNRNNRDPLVNDYKNVNIEISYDNFDTINLDFAKKQQYGQELRSQIEQNRLKKEELKRRKQQEELEEELRLQREREQIEKRQNEENKRYRPKINLPIQTIKVEEKQNNRYRGENQEINEKKNILSDSALNLIRERELEIDQFNNKMLQSLQQIKKEYNYNINSLKGQVGLLNDMHERNKKYNDYKFYKEVNSIKNNIGYKKFKDEIDSKYLYDLVAKSNYAKQMLRYKIGTVPRRKFEIKSYTSDFKIGVDEEPDIPSYVNYSRDVSYKGPRWRQNEKTWWNY